MQTMIASYANANTVTTENKNDCQNCQWKDKPACLWGGKYRCSEYKPKGEP